jgi:hypothetical protein
VGHAEESSREGEGVSRPFTVHDVDQRSDAWRKLRAGLLTASCAGDMMATRKDKQEAAPRRDLRIQLACERITGEPQDDPFISRDMQRGIDVEPEAFAAYELDACVLVQKVGFLTHATLNAGYSPDGIVGDFDGCVELKVPRAANHLRYLRGKTLPPDWTYQITHALWITGAAFCDFATYCAQFPEPLRLFRVRVKREDVDLAAYEICVRTFLAEVDREVDAVQSLQAGAVA